MTTSIAARAGPRARLGFAYVALFLVLGASLPYLPVWLDGRGLTGAQVGLVLAVAMVARFVAVPLVGYAADASQRPGRALTISAACLALALAAHAPASGVVALALVSAVAAAAYGPMVPLLDSVAVRTARAQGFSYGPVRSVGSAAFIVANLIVGVLIARLGSESILVWMLGASLVAAAAMRAVPTPNFASRDPTAPPRLRLRSLLRADIVLALGASALIQGSHAFYYGFSALVWRDAGYSGAFIGVLWAWGVLVEVAFLALLGRRAERLGPVALLAIGGAGAVIRWTAMAFEPGEFMLWPLQALHAATFAATHLGFVVFVARSVPDQAAATAQSLNSALTLGGVLAGASALSGVLYAQSGAAGYAAMAVLAAFGVVCAGALGVLTRSPSVTPR